MAFSERLLQLRMEDPALVDKLIMSDEAHFLLCGKVNKQNMQTAFRGFRKTITK